MNNIWLDRDHLQSRRCGRELQSALTCPGSLTEHLSQYCDRGLTLQLLGEQWQSPLADDVENLPMDPKQRCFIREIHLACAHQPLIYGRSLFPRATYAHCRGQLDRLGQRPMGEWLFSDPHIYRQFTQIGRIGRRSRLYERALSGLPHRPDMLWGRRSVFIVSAQPLLVLEIFLPALITCIHTSGKSKTS